MKKKEIRSLLLNEDDINGFLKKYLEFKKSKFKGVSLRQFSKRLGYKNPSYLSDILSGKRKINLNFLRKFINREKIKGGEASYLVNILDGSENALRENENIKDFWNIQWKEQKDLHHIDMIFYRIIKNFFKEKEALSTKEIITYIKKELFQFTDESLINNGLKRLIDAEVLIKNENDGWKCSDDQISLSKDNSNISSLTELISRARNNSENENYYYSFPFYLSETDFQELKQIIFEMTEKISIFLSSKKDSSPFIEKRLYHSFFSLLPLDK